jgi:hypothetical protein
METITKNLPFLTNQDLDALQGAIDNERNNRNYPVLLVVDCFSSEDYDTAPLLKRLGLAPSTFVYVFEYDEVDADGQSLYIQVSTMAVAQYIIEQHGLDKMNRIKTITPPRLPYINIPVSLIRSIAKAKTNDEVKQIHDYLQLTMKDEHTRYRQQRNKELKIIYQKYQNKNNNDTTKYKTVLCRSWLVGHCNYGAQCCYAHGDKDLH